MVSSIQRVLDYRLEKLSDYQNALKDLEQKRQKSNAKPDDFKLKALVDAVILSS